MNLDIIKVNRSPDTTYRVNEGFGQVYPDLLRRDRMLRNEYQQNKGTYMADLGLITFQVVYRPAQSFPDRLVQKKINVSVNLPTTIP